MSKSKLFLMSSVLALAGLVVPATSWADPASICDAIAGNIVTNCGFETGTFSGWTLANTNATGVESFGFDEGPNSGNYFAALGNVGSDGSVSQTLSTVAGQTYDVSFWLANDGDLPNDFSASFGGTPLVSLSQAPAMPYTLYSFVETSSSGSTLLNFTERNDPGYWGLDDVSVVGAVATPEPSNLVLTGSGLLALAVLLVFRKRTRISLSQATA